MGVLTDFVVADVADVRRVGDASFPSEEFGGLDAKGIDTVKLAALHAALRGLPSGSGAEPELLYEVSEHGPWVLLVPPDLVQGLAALTPADFGRLAAEWAKTEEFSPPWDDWPFEVIEERLIGIAGLARQAVAGKKAVLMWMCL